MNPGDDDPTTTLGVDDAYGLETPDDNRRLYRSWAATYDTDFVARHQYIYHREVVAALASYAAAVSVEPILDVGCGTGIVGDELRALGVQHIDGLDISPEMLAEAKKRTDADGNPIYGQLTEADLTQPLPLAAASYGAVVSSGTFTHGHVGPEALGQLIDLVRPGGLLSLGVNKQFYEAEGFADVLATHRANDRIDRWATTAAQIYLDPPEGHDSASALVLTIVVPE